MPDEKAAKKEEKLRQLYSLAMASANVPAPKRAFLSWK
jgi:hypothetical protein